MEKLSQIDRIFKKSKLTNSLKNYKEYGWFLLICCQCQFELKIKIINLETDQTNKSILSFSCLNICSTII